MVFDPEELYEVDSELPELSGAVLLHQLDGFVDAGMAGQTVTEHLESQFEHTVAARFDVDRLVDYRARRPMMTFAADHWETFEAPELVVRLFHDEAGTPFLLLTGPEPDHEWERYAVAVRSLVDRWHVRMVVNFHGIPMGAPHTRPLGVTAHATRRELIGDYRPVFNQLQVPGSAASLVEFRLGESSHDAVGFAAHVPHYLAQSRYPAAGLTLLGSVSRTTGLSIPDEALVSSARRTDAEIERQVAESDEVAEVVRALERQYDTFAEAMDRKNLLADEVAQMPTAEELGAEFERFLAEQQDRGE
ncbi:proteasome assembly chaperone family protein [Amycolatopsis alkalitolerans]|uniref:PAC2 family protein n=1 Tax=Amycolatopsis alkalitolerans TaxID=2547244 RepID=A0A5C4LT13_9PSEU|nr:PAC2 family protein [Amycolatopsis alkalitolerans]TNC22198.1 PAC2 family protein [Amycolatopsis alkalitolerans]